MTKPGRETHMTGDGAAALAFSRRDVGDGEHAEIAIGERVYRVRTKELA